MNSNGNYPSIEIQIELRTELNKRYNDVKPLEYCSENIFKLAMKVYNINPFDFKGFEVAVIYLDFTPTTAARIINVRSGALNAYYYF